MIRQTLTPRLIVTVHPPRSLRRPQRWSEVEIRLIWNTAAGDGG